MKYKKPRIKLCHHVIISDNNLCIGEIPQYGRIIEDPKEFHYDLIKNLDGQRTVQELITFLQDKHPELDIKTILESIQQLDDEHLLEESEVEPLGFSEAELDFYARQMLYFSVVDQQGIPSVEYQRRLQDTKVAIFGLGGWGSWMTYNLALMGFGKIIAVDSDVVERSNLNRQILYTHEDIGHPKAFAAQKKVKEINPYIEFEGIYDHISSNSIEKITNMLHDADVVILGWANMGYFLENTAEEVIYNQCKEQNIPLLEFAADPFEISIGPLYTYQRGSVCYGCVTKQFSNEWMSNDSNISSLRKSRLDHKFLDGNRKIEAWQFASPISTVAGLATFELVKYITKLEKCNLINKQHCLNLTDLTLKTISLIGNPECICTES